MGMKEHFHANAFQVEIDLNKKDKEISWNMAFLEIKVE
jgi:hypothetical protein